MAKRQTNVAPKAHTHRGSAKLTIPQLDHVVGPANGLFVTPATVDPEIGEEVIVILRDEASVIRQLCQLEPFRLMIRPGVDRNQYGSVGWILFWISEPHHPDSPKISFLKCVDPWDEREVSVWRHLADQNHWHLFLATGNELHDYYSFNNNFELNNGLDIIVARSRQIPEGNSMKARDLFKSQNSVADLMRRPTGYSLLQDLYQKPDSNPERN